MRWRIIAFCLLMPLFAQAQTFEQERISFIENRIETAGPIVNFTGVTQSDDIKAAQSYIEEVIEKLDGPALQKKDIRIQIHIYGTEESLVFLNRLDKKSSDLITTAQNKISKAIKYGWQIGVPSTSQSSWSSTTPFEIGISVGLLKQLKSSSDLAFVIARQLAKIYQPPPKEQSLDKIIDVHVARQRLNFVYDHLALEMISGKFLLSDIFGFVDRTADLNIEEKHLGEKLIERFASPKLVAAMTPEEKDFLTKSSDKGPRLAALQAKVLQNHRYQSSLMRLQSERLPECFSNLQPEEATARRHSTQGSFASLKAWLNSQFTEFMPQPVPPNVRWASSKQLAEGIAASIEILATAQVSDEKITNIFFKLLDHADTEMRRLNSFHNVYESYGRFLSVTTKAQMKTLLTRALPSTNPLRINEITFGNGYLQLFTEPVIREIFIEASQGAANWKKLYDTFPDFVLKRNVNANLITIDGFLRFFSRSETSSSPEIEFLSKKFLSYLQKGTWAQEIEFSHPYQGEKRPYELIDTLEKLPSTKFKEDAHHAVAVSFQTYKNKWLSGFHGQPDDLLRMSSALSVISLNNTEKDTVQKVLSHAIGTAKEEYVGWSLRPATLKLLAEILSHAAISDQIKATTFRLLAEGVAIKLEPVILAIANPYISRLSRSEFMAIVNNPITSIATNNSQTRAAQIHLILQSPGIQSRLLQELTLDDAKTLLDSFQKTSNYTRVWQAPADLLLNLLRLHTANLSRYEILNFVNVAESLDALALERDVTRRREIVSSFTKHFKNLNLGLKTDFLNNKSTWTLLDKKDVMETLKEQAIKMLPEKPTAEELIKLLNPKEFSNNTMGRLFTERPQTYEELKRSLVEHYRLQPSDYSVLKSSPYNVLSGSEGYSKMMRNGSALVLAVRKTTPEEQLQVIDYLMGRNPALPSLINVWSQPSQATGMFGLESFPAASVFLQLRDYLTEADIATRALTINSILIGSDGMLSNASGTDLVINHLLESLSPENRALAKTLARNILRAEGSNASLALAYFLAQRPNESKKMSEGLILRALFEAFGVPGKKLGQYLAFTSKFRELAEALSSLQDDATPVDYFEILKAIHARFGNNWPKDLQVVHRLASGTVNHAIEYVDKNTGKKEVVSLLVEDVEKTNEFDNQRLQNVLREVARDSETKGEFEFLPGLLDVIQSSVSLEFNKANAFEMQKAAQEIYRGTFQVNDQSWTIEVPDAKSTQNGALFMDKAYGVTAAKLKKLSPQDYQNVMAVIAQRELAVLFGVKKSGEPRPVSIFANPDLHDGQVIIDVENRKVTILDFGQAAPITNEERQIGLDLLKIVTKAENPEKSAEILNSIIARLNSGSYQFVAEDLENIYRQNDSMDSFIRLLSLLNEKGLKIPLSSVHWILGINRVTKLGEKINLPIKNEIRNLLLAQKIGLGFQAVNTFRNFRERLSGLFVTKTQPERTSGGLSCKKVFEQ